MATPPALGPHVAALVDLVQSWRARKRPHATATRLARATSSPELRALFEGWAKHEGGHLAVGEYGFEDHDLGGYIPAPSEASDDTFATGKVVIGHSPGGDLFVVELAPTGKQAPVWRVVHDEDWTPYREAPNLESFLRKCAKAATQASDADNPLVIALDKARRAKSPAYQKAQAAAASCAKGGAIGWIPKQLPAAEAESPAVRAARKAHPDAYVLAGVPYPVVIADDPRNDRESRVSLLKGKHLAKLAVPLLCQYRAALSPDGTSVIVGSPVQLFRVEIKTGRVHELPYVGWVNDVVFIDNTTFVVATAGGIHEPERGAATVEKLLAKQHDHGGRAWLVSEEGLHVFAIDAKGSVACVQRLAGTAETMSAFFGRFLVLRSRAEGKREKKSEPRTWVFALKDGQLVFLAALPKDPGELTARGDRIFGEDGFELVHFEAAAARAAARPATHVPWKCGAKPAEIAPPQASLPAVAMRPVTGAPPTRKPVRAVEMPARSDWQSAPASNGVRLGALVKSGADSRLVVHGAKGSAKPRRIEPALYCTELDYAFNADGSRCVVILHDGGSQAIWDIATATGKATQIDEYQPTFSACAYLGDWIVLAKPFSALECFSRQGETYDNEPTFFTMCDRLFLVDGGRRVLTGVNTDATYIGAPSVVVELVDGKPAVVGQLAQGITRAWEKSGKTLVTAADGKTYEVGARS
ncbi:MAG: SMI1/KNR4 family protein [Myxococcota bacterium]|nr:SMI1/KNR4 family protein [Myxococcota bacterium]